MNRTLLTLALSGLLALSLAMPAAALPQIGDVAPDFTLKTLDGEQEYTLSELSGQVVYIDFWASWCGPCRRSFPEVSQLYSEFNDQGFLVLAVSLDRKLESAIKFIAQQEVEFPAVIDQSGKVATTYGVRSIPTALIVGADGKVAYSAIGFDPRKMPQLKATIEELLAKIPAEDKEINRVKAGGNKS